MPNNWTQKELRASVCAYIEMREKESRGEKFTKKSYYKGLSKQFGRTIKAYEYRMQNISHVYDLMGRKWLSGLKPKKNVGVKVAKEIEQLICEVEKRPLNDVVSYETRVEVQRKKQREKPPKHPPQGSKRPQWIPSSGDGSYKRDEDVAAWVLNQAGERCECCGSPAPFERSSDGSKYLEIHHVKGLADGGPDIVSNAVAICPNCHRELHYGARKESLSEELRQKVDRLD